MGSGKGKTLDLIEFLNARLDEDEHVGQEARHSGQGRWHQTDPDRQTGRIEDERGEIVVYDEGSPSGWEAEHIARHDPARVLRRVEADREIIEMHKPRGDNPACRVCAEWLGDDDRPPSSSADWPCQTIKLLALPHADHPDYREEWKP